MKIPVHFSKYWKESLKVYLKEVLDEVKGFNIHPSVVQSILKTYDNLEADYVSNYIDLIIRLLKNVNLAVCNPKRKLFTYPNTKYPDYCLYGTSLPMTNSYQTSERIVFHMLWQSKKLTVVKMEIEDLPWFKKS